MKILITGANGQLGHDVVKECVARNISHKGVDLNDFDITDESAVLEAFALYNPTVVVHCAAYTAVDKAEDEPEVCNKINVDGTRNIALACKKLGAKMLYISTDYVFAGDGEHSYQPSDSTAPISVYGKSKLGGERVVQELLENYFIVRISWAFGENGNNFVKTMLRLGKERDSLNVVCDQVGSPTYTADLAPLLCEIALSDKFGIYHATNEGTCSWAEFAQEIFRQAELSVNVNPIPTSEYPTKATRPLNSRLDKTCLVEAGFNPLPHWAESLKQYVSALSVS